MGDPAAIEVGGLVVPDAGPVFLAALAVHVLAGLAAVVAAVLAATAVKRPGRHPAAGTVYLRAIYIVFLTGAVMAVIRWREDRGLVAIAVVALVLALSGRRVRRRRPALHGALMAGSVAALITGFLVDNGPQLPVWDRLPPVSYWLLPTAIAVPLTLIALIRGRRRSTLDVPDPLNQHCLNDDGAE